MHESRFSAYALALAFAFFTVACGQGSATGPGEIHWDRQTCEHCQMVISDRRYAAQLRMPGAKTTNAFDDLGCALLWLDEQGLLAGDDSEVEVWVRDPTGEEWIDGRKARFGEGFATPMAYGFAPAEEGIPLPEVQARIVRAERRRRSTGPDRPKSEEHRSGTEHTPGGESEDG